jgi:hypothetical protein
LFSCGLAAVRRLARLISTMLFLMASFCAAVAGKSSRRSHHL